MNLTAGTRLGPYELVAPIGAGAMGDVYKARDTRLDRDVAVKVLPPAFARDPDRLMRFEREARAVAAITHPNILALYDIGSADLVDPNHTPLRAAYIVTELLDGETLRARLDAGALPIRKAVDVAIQVARGLAAAHARGIVHRDLKPENIVLTRDGHAKILDFGLAKQSTGESHATMAATEAGVVMGTVGYMAPEQVRGEAADTRSDLFALGAVLYELVSGRRAFERPTAAETMTAVLREDPPPLPSTISPELERIVHHAIEKEPSDRFQSARDFSFALQALGESRTSSAEAVATPAARRRTSNREWAAWSVAAVASAMAIALLLAHRPGPSTTSSSKIFAVSVPWNDSAAASPAVSPDGTRIAFIASSGAGDAIWVRPLDRVNSQSLNGTANVRRGSLFWSPDGRSLGFVAGGKLKTVDVDSGKINDVADAPTGYGGSWGTDGTILFSPDERGPILRVNAAGGAVTAVTALDPAGHEQAHRWPAFLPDGRHFVFMTWDPSLTTRNIKLGSVDGTAPSKTLFEARSAAIVGGNYLLYVLEPPSRLMAQAFDPRTLQLEGRPVSVVPDDNIDFDWFPGNPGASASAGVLVYTTGKYRPSQLTWFNRVGRSAGTLGDAGVYYDPTSSPDGSTLAVERRDEQRGTTDLWTIDLARGAFSRLTSTPGFESVATWSPDGRRIAFASDQTVSARLLVKNANGTGTEDVLVDGRSFPTDWSADGRYILFMTDGGPTQVDVWVYDVARKTANAVLASSFNETRAKFSPDGKWIAYVSDESREPQVYVQSFPDGAQKIQISAVGGNQPEWRRDGNELFYLAPEPDSMLMAAELHTSGGQLTVGSAQALFPTYVEQSRVIRNDYTASADGQKFLVMSPLGARKVSPLVAVLNWANGLSQ